MNSPDLLSLIGVCFSSVMAVLIAVISHRGARDSKAANDAVNHRHAGQPRLFDLAIKNHDIAKELRDWKRGYESTPWKDGDGVKCWLDKHEAEMQKLKEKTNQQKHD